MRLRDNPVLADFRGRLAVYDNLDPSERVAGLKKCLFDLVRQRDFLTSYRSMAVTRATREHSAEHGSFQPFGPFDIRNIQVSYAAQQFGQALVEVNSADLVLVLPEFVEIVRHESLSDKTQAPESRLRLFQQSAYDHACEAIGLSVLEQTVLSSLPKRLIVRNWAGRTFEAARNLRDSADRTAFALALPTLPEELIANGRRKVFTFSHKDSAHPGITVLVDDAATDKPFYLESCQTRFDHPQKTHDFYDGSLVIPEAGVSIFQSSPSHTSTPVNVLACSVLCEMGLSYDQANSLFSSYRVSVGLSPVFDWILMIPVLPRPRPIKISGTRLADWIIACSDAFPTVAEQGEYVKPLPTVSLKDLVPDTGRGLPDL